MSYQVPNHVDKDKIFIINRSEIDGRLDAQFYKSYFTIPDSIRLSTFAKVLGGKRIPKGKSFSDVDTPYLYLRVADIDSDSDINYGTIKCIEKEVFDILKRYEIKEQELAISIAGTVGKVSLIKDIPIGKSIILTENCAKIVIKEDSRIKAEYLRVLFTMPFIQKQLERYYIQTTVPKLGLDKILRLKFPAIPPIKFQNRIISEIQTALEDKKKKEGEAQQLLDKIDAYLLQELGVSLPDEKKDLSDRVFYTSFKTLTGKRIDPKKYSSHVQQLLQCLHSTKYETTTLRNLVTSSCSGDWGEDNKCDVPDGYVRCLTLRATEIDNQFNLDVNPEKVKYRLIKNDHFANLDISENDIIIEKSGGSDDQPVGRVAILDKSILDTDKIAISNFLMKIRVSGVNPMYLYCFLKTMYNIGVTDSMQSQTNGIRNLIISEFFSQIIIVPSPEKQKELVDHILEMRNTAKKLLQEGLMIVEMANKATERLILNGNLIP